MTLKKQIISIIASGAVLLQATIPAFADTTLVISGNGADSKNEVKIESNQSTLVTQNNDAKINNQVNASSDTGDNEAEENTGGDVSISTGDATTDVNVQNTVNSNAASVDCCGNNDVDVLISGNGADSDNKVELKDEKDSGVQVFQDNNADVKNHVDADSNSGDNEAEENTGGDVSIETGDASTTVGVSTTANANWAQVGGNGSNPTLSLRIVDNGADTKNKIKLDLDGGVLLTQNNDAKVVNDVDADADTGDNEAEENTGGDVSIETGDATVDVTVDNMVNFNWADVDCGCLFDLLAKIEGNGVDSDNKLEAKLGGDLEVFQDNVADKLKNDVDADADSGDNEAEENTGDVEGSDPSIVTGDADTTVEVGNAGNSNSYGADVPADFPEVGFNFNVSLSWAQLMALLGL
ncbi:hypothetical protein A2973_02295 [Candidatus Gottesmanbacteria bacterium RIFCSPLOWO2_01_FULL_49_10]|uniref:Uncharacterized protein n=1 Tax=Candidatus Gottesmanbacteria bacterium RIFCSPLOWO2_01_FULL_49_10 TaxID=1798396 RepID=A0A1F6AZK3_9BACT|nr:MAG: hypothetical protein UY10_C0035G0004 [Microgenomates group bacterium GW2011_GWA2_47_8]OGG30115.1 MAG: hypothetical protein A2973_02295 [Candidatus Gottesmanbacteria bacterium RIFCSPLOWO2_01_FULL_49_10]